VISHGAQELRIDFQALTGARVMVYGQTEITKDLYELRAQTGGATVFEAKDVALHDLEGDAPYVTYLKDGTEHRVGCDYIAGCDGFHGVSRQSIPRAHRQEVEQTYPFGWLGVLSETPPVHDELIYARSQHGFALCSMRHANLSRYYIQTALDDDPNAWSDAAFWDALRQRLPERYAQALVTGSSLEKSIAPLRSFVCTPMQWGRLFLCGDAAHIVPPTGAKGLNTAAGDVQDLARGFVQAYQERSREGLAGYSDTALARVWKTQRFSWWMTRLLHVFPGASEFETQMQLAEIDDLHHSRAAQMTLAEHYVGQPYQP